VSHISSAGIALDCAGYGTTCRKDVLRRVDVPVVPGAAGLEPRVTCTPGEERGERLVLVAERLLERNRGDLVQELQDRVLFIAVSAASDSA
jgi:hypothetical protein